MPWPETAADFLFQTSPAYPVVFRLQGEYRQKLLDLAEAINKPILFGAPAFAFHRGVTSTYNRAYLVDGSGKIIDYYDKQILVPVGEYLPAPWLLGRLGLKRIVEAPSDFVPGTRGTIFTAFHADGGDAQLRFGRAIKNAMLVSAC